jgi:hypothetical protein
MLWPTGWRARFSFRRERGSVADARHRLLAIDVKLPGSDLTVILWLLPRGCLQWLLWRVADPHNRRGGHSHRRRRSQRRVLLCGFGLRRLIPQHLFRPDSKALRVEPERQCRESNLVLRASLGDQVAACVATTRYGAVASNHSRNFTRTGQQSDASTNVLLFAKRRRFAMRLVHHADWKWPSESDPLLVPTAIHKPTQGS